MQSEKNQLGDTLLFTGTACGNVLEGKGSSIRKEFLKQVREAYVVCAESLQRKLPLQNNAIKMCAALDPQVRGTKTCLAYLQKMPSHFCGDRTAYDKEIRRYNLDKSIVCQDVPVDQYWSEIDNKNYPNLTAAAKALLSSFHGPLVESSFSSMGDLMNEKSGHMTSETYQALQTIRFHLKAKGQSAVEAFKKKDPVRDPVCKRLCVHMKNAYKGRQDRQQRNKAVATDKRERVGASVPASKKADKEDLLIQASIAKSAHMESVKKAATVDVITTCSQSELTGRKRPCSSPDSEKSRAKRLCESHADSLVEEDNVCEQNSAPVPPRSTKGKQTSISSFFKK